MMAKPNAFDEHLYRHVNDNLNTAVLLFDQDLVLRHLNPAAEELFGLSEHRALGQPAAVLFMKHGHILQYLQDVIQRHHPFTEREMPLPVSDDHQVVVDVTFTPIQEAGNFQGVLVELLRVDRLQRITREESLITQNQASRMLVRGIAHEIKNPLGGLRGAAQLLEKELTDPELKEYTRIIIGEADRLRNLVNKMLGPNSVPHNRDTNIHNVLERVRSLVLAETGDDIIIRRDYDPSIPLLRVDIDQLIQAVLNIVKNAVRALDGRGTITLKTRIERQFTIGNHRHRLVARIDIMDNGVGIDADLLETIFYPMVTGFDEGTGLGLSIAQSIVNQYGGLIECESQPGNTVFTILLPIETEGDEH